MTDAQRLLLEQCKQWKPVPEMRFHPTRRWRIDVAFPEYLLAVEIDGGIWNGQGRHVRGAGVVKDMEKFAALAALGWRVIRVTPKMCMDGTALGWVRQAIERAA